MEWHTGVGSTPPVRKVSLMLLSDQDGHSVGASSALGLPSRYRNLMAGIHAHEHLPFGVASSDD
jgi:hypothetical protein